MNGRDQGQPLRNMSMNAFGTQQSSRQTPRLQNTPKTGLGNGSAGANWVFGAPSSGGFGGLGGAPGAPGRGPARLTQLSGFAQAMGGGGQAQIDMSDFPSLSNGSRPQQSTPGGWSSAAIRQPTAQPNQAAPPQAPPQATPQQSQQRAPSAAPSHHSLDQFDGQRSHPHSHDRAAGGRDDSLAALENLSLSDVGRQTTGLASASLGSPVESQSQSNGQAAQLPIRDASGSATNSNVPSKSQAPIGTSQPTSQSQPPPRGQNPPATTNANVPAVKRYADMTDNEKWGLAGLNAVFEARRQLDTPGGQVDETLPPAMRNAILLMGQDLNTLGMDLDSMEPLHPTFTPFPAHNSYSSPYDFKDKHPIPHFTLPPAYTVTNVPPMAQRMGSFSDETLFHCFYTMPGDICQEIAACELASRDWRWHKALRQWLRKDGGEPTSNAPIYDRTNGATPGQQTVRLSDNSERGVYIFFNQIEWRRERREFTLDYDHLEVPRSGPSVGPPLPNDTNPRTGNMAGLDPNFAAPGASGAPPRQSSVLSGPA